MIKELDSDFDEIILGDSIELIVGMDLSFNSTGLTFTTTINGHTVNYQSIVSEAQNPVNSNNPCILINAIIDGNTRKIYMNY